MMPPLRLRELNPEEQWVIHTLVRSRTASIRLVDRAKIIEQASQGKTIQEIASTLHLKEATVEAL